MARPTFQIDQQRLQALRKEKDFTQLELATKTKELLGKRSVQSKETLISGYQKIEKTGNTSRKMAEALATVLDVSVELLQGVEQPEPLDYLKRITSLLKVQIENKENLALQRILARIADEGDDDPLPHLVQEIGERVEAVQLGRNPSEINELIELTGLSESELLKPANVLGHWFVTATSRSYKRSEIIHGEAWTCGYIKEIITDFLEHGGCDASIRMWRDEFWFRIEINRPQRNDKMRIDFVRCLPDAKGLCWSSASWRDEFMLYGNLSRWAYSAANFVTEFEGTQSPINLRQLRLIVTEEVTTDKVDSFVRSQRKMVISGRLDEIPESTKESSQQAGFVHNLFVDKLIADLRHALMPHLTEYPAKYWKISAYDGISISLTPPRTRGKLSLDELRYRITLAEEVSPNEFVRVPWRQKDQDSQGKKIEDWLKNPYSPSDEDDPIPRFEPI